MTESKFETVSSLVDNYQLDDKELIDVSNDEQMSYTWSRYHLIGDVLRDDAPSTIDLDISLNIASAIAAEPTVLAPQRKTVTQQVKATVIKLAKPFWSSCYRGFCGYLNDCWCPTECGANRANHS